MTPGITSGRTARLTDWGEEDPGPARKGRTKAVIGRIGSTVIGAPTQKCSGDNPVGICVTAPALCVQRRQ